MEGGIIDDFIVPQFAKARNQAVFSRLRRVLWRFLKFGFIWDQKFHCIQIIKLVDDYNPVSFIRFCDYNAIVFSQISQNFSFFFAKNVFFFREIIRVAVAIRYLFQLTFESVQIFSCQRGPRLHEITERSSNEHFTSYRSTFLDGRQKRNPLANTIFSALLTVTSEDVCRNVRNVK